MFYWWKYHNFYIGPLRSVLYANYISTRDKENRKRYVRSYIKFNDEEVSDLPVPVIAKLGLLRTFQQTRIYGKLNCVDNMLISHKGSDESILKIFSKIPKSKSKEIV